MAEVISVGIFTRYRMLLTTFSIHLGLRDAQKGRVEITFPSASALPVNRRATARVNIADSFVF